MNWSLKKNYILVSEEPIQKFIFQKLGTKFENM